MFLSCWCHRRQLLLDLSLICFRVASKTTDPMSRSLILNPHLKRVDITRVYMNETPLSLSPPTQTSTASHVIGDLGWNAFQLVAVVITCIWVGWQKKNKFESTRPIFTIRAFLICDSIRFFLSAKTSALHNNLEDEGSPSRSAIFVVDRIT